MPVRSSAARTYGSAPALMSMTAMVMLPSEQDAWKAVAPVLVCREKEGGREREIAREMETGAETEIETKKEESMKALWESMG